MGRRNAGGGRTLTLRSTLVGLAAAAVFLLVPAITGHAGAPNPLDLQAGTVNVAQVDTRIERQSWFLPAGGWDPNHTILANTAVGTWDINDHVDIHAYGYLAAGTSTAATWRHIWDYNPIYACRDGLCAWWSGMSNAWGTYVAAPSPNLVVEDCIEGRCFRPQPVYDPSARVYWWAFCGQAVYRWGDAALIAVPGSQAVDGSYGYGAPDTLTVTVSNPGVGKKATVKNIQVGWGLSSDVIQAPGCSDNGILSGFTARTGLTARADYPFKWFGSGL